jgi:hypothetical protein
MRVGEWLDVAENHHDVCFFGDVGNRRCSRGDEPMSSPLRVECSFYFRQNGRTRELAVGDRPGSDRLPTGRLPRISRLMALAIRFDRMLQEGSIVSYADVARLGRVTPARVSQIMALLQLAPDIQEEILFLPALERGRGPIHMWKVLPIAGLLSWPAQRRRWRALGSDQLARER